MGFSKSHINPKYLMFVASINSLIPWISCTPTAKHNCIIMYVYARSKFSLPTARSLISQAIKSPTSNSYPTINPTINAIRTELSTLSPLVGQSLCQASFYHALASNIKVYLSIICDTTPRPSTTYTTFLLFNAIKITIHKKYLILSFEPSFFLLTFHISSMR